VPSAAIKKTLDIKNSGPLQTSITLKIDPPFSCNTEKLHLAPDKTEVIEIEFDPGMWQERVSEDITRKLSISHDGHPHKDFVQLCGEVCFPNLKIMPPDIHFGCILNDTSKKKYLDLTNISQMPVSYEWSFLEEETASLSSRPIEEKKKGKKKKKLPINEVFDILPVSGTLGCGEGETVEFTFYAGNMLHYSGIAICSVDGGPDYRVQIDGESSKVAFEISEKELDYGEIAYNESSTKTFEVHNLGAVPFEFSVNLSKVSRSGLIECYPMNGKVAAKEKFEVQCKFYPGIPDNITEVFQVECAHFPPRSITVKAVGIFPGCLLSFPRAQDDQEFSLKYEETKKLLLKKKITYSALFSSEQALKNMPALQTKKGDKDKSMVQKEPFAMEVEAETDRITLCEKILGSLDTNNAKSALAFTSGTGFGFGSGAPDRSAVMVAEGRAPTEGTTERGGIGSQPKKAMGATGMKGAKKSGAQTKSMVTAADDNKSL
jgi:hypothetical protein